MTTQLAPHGGAIPNRAPAPASFRSAAASARSARAVKPAQPSDGHALDHHAMAPAELGHLAAARFLGQASFGPTPATIAALTGASIGAWIDAQLALPASAVPPATDLNTLRSGWYKNMASGPDQLRQRMIFALAQVFVLSADKNPHADEIRPWLATLSAHAFGNFKELLRAMTLNPAMGKYFELGNSSLPAPNDRYARAIIEQFTLGPVLLNQDGSEQRDLHGAPVATCDQARITDFADALSGWTYVGTSSTGLNWENMAGPLQPRNNYHDQRAKTLLDGAILAAGQGIEHDLDAVLDNLFRHQNLAPFIATRLIQQFVTGEPSPAYVARVAKAFSGAGGELAATLQALLLDPEARADATSPPPGHLKDPMLHTIGLMRAMNATVIDPSNLFWDYFLAGQRITGSPLTRRDGADRQAYSPAQAVARAKLVYRLINGDHNGMVRFDLAAYERAPGTPALLDLVDANLLAGRMSAAARSDIGAALQDIGDAHQRALTALYLAAISAEFA